ncbi:MAG: hypothetical protein ACE5IE_02600 [Dehalococcoidia bacterium]
MGEIKSAFEKALERAERIGKLSPEEMRGRQEEEYATIGRALADRYLRHGYGEILGEEANKYSGEERDIVTRAALSRLVEAMELGNYEITQRAMEGIPVLRGKEKVREVKVQIKSLLDEYKKAEKERYETEKEEIGRKERGLLHQLRISGSAVGEINLEASESWKEVCQELYSQYDKRLGALKVQLLQAVQ